MRTYGDGMLKQVLEYCAGHTSLWLLGAVDILTISTLYGLIERSVPVPTIAPAFFATKISDPA
jgi:hypothetical protein